jgi:heme exporter protein D
VRKDEQPENKTPIGNRVWSIFGATALIAIAALVIVSIPDIKRYIRISTM